MERQETTPRAIEALEAAGRDSITSMRVGALHAAALHTPSTTPPASPAYERIVDDRPVRRRGGNRDRPRGAAAARPRAVRSIPRRAGDRTGRSRRRPLDLAESDLMTGVGPTQTQTLAALEIAPTFERAQDLLLRSSRARAAQPGGIRRRARQLGGLARVHGRARPAVAGARRADAPGSTTSASPGCSGASSASSTTTSPKAPTPRRTTTASRGPSTARPPSRTCRAGSRP